MDGKEGLHLHLQDHTSHLALAYLPRLLAAVDQPISSRNILDIEPTKQKRFERLHLIGMGRVRCPEHGRGGAEDM